MSLLHLWYRWMFLAIFVMPLWLLFGWIIFGPHGFNFLFVVFGAPITLFVLAGVTLVTYLRHPVRETKNVSWLDVGTQLLFELALIATTVAGFNGWWVVLDVILLLLVVWAALSQLLRGHRQWSADAQSGLGATGTSAGVSPPGDVIVVNEQE